MGNSNQRQGEEAAAHVAADGLVEFVEDRAGQEQVLGGAEGLLHRPQLLVITDQRFVALLQVAGPVRL